MTAINFKVEKVSKNDYAEIVEVWEASVRATHTFLTEDDITYFKPLILNQYLDTVTLRCLKDENGNILGFIGVSDNSLEMLFLSPKYRGMGLGKHLLKLATEEFGVTKVDVNEQNPEACGFYKHFGFSVIGRSDLDGSGKPYPILHMELNK
ncbi:GNAT family N-acetyltransferase [Roseivirga pacifica]|uniref:GNAT family N-acetyltransferase n=1 Tax=Roseivirga pacifica TaxID=1267423 RepID=UPI00227D48DD|nr:GNAT family N-acetyltransferase [Roseivirga pacifica]